MEIKVADERILIVAESLSFDKAEKKAWEKKIDAFGTINKVASFLARPKDEEFELTYKEYRFQPFWHVAANARYVYDRNSTYQVATGGSEVKSVTIDGKDFEVTNGHVHVSVVEHCKQESTEVAIIDGLTGQKGADFSRYLKSTTKEVSADELQKTAGDGAIIVPPQARVSGIMREMLSKMIKGIQADKIFEEHVEVTCVDLYYHPVFAFQYRWKPKEKEAIVEVDGVTGEVRAGSRIFKEYLGKVLDPDFLFDLGADAAGMFIPGGSIAVKVAKKYIDSKKSG